MDRLSLGRMQNPVRGMLHGLAAIISVIGLIVLATAVVGEMLISSVVYGLSLIALYATSALYHSVPWRAQWKDRFQRLDHTLIYVLVAATMTPLMIGLLDGVMVEVGLASIWAFVASGACREIWPRLRRWWWLGVQMGIGAIALVPLTITLVRMDYSVLGLTLGGGAVYLVGVVMFVNSRPRLLPGVFSHHELFHVLVVLASLSHYLAVWEVATGSPAI
jgi:hemolysin III